MTARTPGPWAREFRVRPQAAAEGMEATFAVSFLHPNGGLVDVGYADTRAEAIAMRDDYQRKENVDPCRAALLKSLREAVESGPAASLGVLLTEGLDALDPFNRCSVCKRTATREDSAGVALCQHHYDGLLIDDLTAQRDRLAECLRDCQRLFTEALPKFNWGASALDANAITLLNEVPGKVAKALASLKEGA